MRVSDNGADQSAQFYSSSDDLIKRVELPEFHQLLSYIAESLQKTIKAANANVWPSKLSLNLEFAGSWFQIQNHGAFHDIHSHGNCSWSGVYYVQLDPAVQRHKHKVLGALNGMTRFYGPYQNWLGGAYMDMGNAYLQQPHFDVCPEAGMLVLFPSYLNHKAMPYEGVNDRIVVSFNVQIHGAQGDKIFNYAAS
ncbi:hypothetical protein GALL_194950 [mine drainage metagenome]|uniref:Fe2OG dioxygenase domain-containing protein n=1 Tax=mine drainage metagenome TaxID=410659 RepID=A0A1J5RQE6_9ZZZZ